MRARIMILLSQIEVEIREVRLSNKPKEMTDLSKKGTVPVLLLPNKEVLDESINIMNWSLNISDPQEIIQSIKNNKKESNLILKKFDSEFKYHLDRYKYHSRYKNDHKLKNKEDHRDLALEILKMIELKLNSKKSWIFGNYPSYLDIAILPFIRQYRIADNYWFDKVMPLKKTHHWLMQFLEWETFLKSMKKYKIWQPEDQPIYFRNYN